MNKSKNMKTRNLNNPKFKEIAVPAYIHTKLKTLAASKNYYIHELATIAIEEFINRNSLQKETK